MNALNILDFSVNVGKSGRIQSLVAGASLLVSGIDKMKQSPKISILKTMLGGYLLYRGISGHCHVSQMTNRSTSREF